MDLEWIYKCIVWVAAVLFFGHIRVHSKCFHEFCFLPSCCCAKTLFFHEFGKTSFNVVNFKKIYNMELNRHRRQVQNWPLFAIEQSSTGGFFWDVDQSVLLSTLSFHCSFKIAQQKGNVEGLLRNSDFHWTYIGCFLKENITLWPHPVYSEVNFRLCGKS